MLVPALIPSQDGLGLRDSTSAHLPTKHQLHAPLAPPWSIRRWPLAFALALASLWVQAPSLSQTAGKSIAAGQLFYYNAVVAAQQEDKEDINNNLY